MDRIPIKKQQYLNLFKDNFSKTQHLLGPFLESKFKDPDFNRIACHCIAHDWNKKCLHSALILFFGSFKKSIKVYASLYIISAILRGKSIKYFLTKLPYEILRSTAFLAANCFYFLGFFCLSRKLFGGVSYWGTLLANVPACFLSIIMERKQRRGLLALYLTNLAAETAFKMLVNRKLIPSMKNGEVLLFALGSAVYALLYKMKCLEGGVSNLIKMLIGSSEIIEPDHRVHSHKQQRQSRVVKYYGFMTVIVNNLMTIFHNMFVEHHNRHQRSHNFIITYLRELEKKIEHFLDSFNKSNRYRHKLCHHRYNCFIYSIVGFIQRFIVGYFLQAVFKLIGNLGSVFKKPNLIFKIIKSPVNFQLGMFLASYVFVFRSLSCLLRWVTNKNSKIHGLIAGFFSGWSMIFYKSSSIALYLDFKLLEVLWMIGVKSNSLPLYKSFDIVLYTLSTAFILWVALYEPHNIREAYWRFLVKVSDNKFAEVNRFILDEFGVNSSTIDKAIKFKK